MYIPTAQLVNDSGTSLIQTITMAAPGSVVFSGIPGGYTNLLLIGYIRQDAAITGGTIRVRFNGDGGNNYNQELFSYTNATVAAAGLASQAQIEFGQTPGNSATANYFGSASLWIPNYANTVGFKSCHGHTFTSTSAAAANQAVHFGAGIWFSTAAITSITIFGASGAGDLTTGSKLSLYGLE